MANLTKEKSVEAGGNVWEKGNMVRVYFSSKDQIAKLFNLAVVESMAGMTPKGFNGKIKSGKTRSYYDVANNVFCADSGDIANAARDADLQTKRI